MTKNHLDLLVWENSVRIMKCNMLTMLDLRFSQQCCWRFKLCHVVGRMRWHILKALLPFKMWGTTRLMTQHHVPEDFMLLWFNPLTGFYGWEVFEHCTGWMRSHRTPTQYAPKINLSLHSTAQHRLQCTMAMWQ
jgi:hypothetical protein